MKYFDENDLELLEWLPQSLDLNPIENFGILKNKWLQNSQKIFMI